MKRIIVIGQFPPPIHGLSHALQTLINSQLSQEFKLIKLDIKDNKKFVNHCAKIIQSKTDGWYFTPAQTAGGNLRDLVYMMLMAISKKPIIVHLHGGGFKKAYEKMNYFQKRLNQFVFSRVSKGIVLSDSLKEILLPVMDIKKISVVNNFVDSECTMDDITFKNKQVSQKNKKSLKILYLSNFIRSKGYDIVLEIANRLSKIYYIQLEFNFAGAFLDVGEREYFFNKLKQMNSQSILFHGIVEGSTKKKLFAESDIFILPTQYPIEGQPISILEAMANGCCILSTPHAGIPDIIKSGINGYLIPQDCVEEYCNKIIELNTQRELLTRIGKTNYEKAKSKYLISCHIEALRAEFENTYLKTI
ncbi:MAG: glycosyltransferase family 4 protein [Clostridia bacterium]|nr:glycosyltransferase family 4 protein [Clostridia bacterium]